MNIHIPKSPRVHMRRKTKRFVRTILIRVALFSFALDLISALFPPFYHVWSHIEHLAVAVASFSAFAVEHLIMEDYEKERESVLAHDIQ